MKKRDIEDIISLLVMKINELEDRLEKLEGTKPQVDELMKNFFKKI